MINCRQILCLKFFNILRPKHVPGDKMFQKSPFSYYLVDQYNSTYHHFIHKKPINADYSALTENIKTNPKATKFEVNDRVGITIHKNILVKVTLKIGQEKYL